MRIKIDKNAEYIKELNNNTDFYSRACYTFAERFAELLEIEYLKLGTIPMEQIIEEYAEKFSHDADVEGITGFMYGCAMSILARYWEYGDILNKWHNRRYGVEDAEGTVNPAIWSIS